MNKSYKCDFCAYDTGPLMATNENCTNCMYGSCFKLKPRMAGCQKDTWLGHRKLDKFLKINEIHLLPNSHDLVHRLIIPQPACRYDLKRTIPLSLEVRALRRTLTEAIRKVKLEDEDE